MRVAVIACVKEKRTFPCKAIELYQGPLFQAWLNKAKLWKADKILILSGKHGLLSPETIIQPYDFNLDIQSKEMQDEWGEKVLKQFLQETSISKDHFLFCCNEIYLKPFLSLQLSMDLSAIKS